MIAATILRGVSLAGLLALTTGCDLILAVPNLGEAGNVASMTARFKAAIQAESGSPAPLDWGLADRHIWRHYLGPGVVEFCGRPADAPATQRAYQINFYRGSFGSIGDIEVATPAHPSQTPTVDFCGREPNGVQSAAEP